MKRIGELLIERGLVEPKVLERALAKQASTGQRLCSLLIASGALSADDAARALGEQHGVPALLQKHLAHRDPALADRVPATFAREHHVLPIGRTGAGELIVWARDPRPALRDELARITNERIVLAAAPAELLAELHAQSYSGAVPGEIEVDLASGAITSGQLPDLTADLAEEPDAPPFAELGALTLVELDDRRVTRDLTQSGSFATPPLAPTLPVVGRAPTAPVIGRAPTAPVIGRAPTAPVISRTATTPRTSLSAIAHPLPVPPPPSDELAAGTQPPSRDALTGSSVERVLDKAMQLAAERWSAVLLLAIKDRLALGHRGHGEALGADTIRGVAIPLSAPSIVRAAYDTRARVSRRTDGAGAVQERVDRLLGRPAAPAAMPIVVGGTVAFIVLVGDPLTGDAPWSAQELQRFGTELAAALARLAVT